MRRAAEAEDGVVQKFSHAEHENRPYLRWDETSMGI